jgi:predicted transcriptional regulator
LGRPCDVFGSDTRRAIREALKAGNQTPTEIAEAAGLDYDLCAKTLQRMVEGGEVQKGGRGRYRLTPDPFAT